MNADELEGRVDDLDRQIDGHNDEIGTLFETTSNHGDSIARLEAHLGLTAMTADDVPTPSVIDHDVWHVLLDALHELDDTIENDGTTPWDGYTETPLSRSGGYEAAIERARKYVESVLSAHGLVHPQISTPEPTPSAEVESKVTALARSLRDTGWDSARVEHLGGNVEGVRIDIPAHVVQRRTITPPMILLVTDHGEEPYLIGCYATEEDIGSEAWGYQGATTFSGIQQVLNYYRSIQVNPATWGRKDTP